MREEIETTDSREDILLKMGEGNPGALTILKRIIDAYGKAELDFLLNLDDMNMRGSQIWIGYKDHCGEDFDRFIECVRTRDQDMVDTVNKECGSYVLAVTRGASDVSFNRESVDITQKS